MHTSYMHTSLCMDDHNIQYLIQNRMGSVGYVFTGKSSRRLCTVQSSLWRRTLGQAPAASGDPQSPRQCGGPSHDCAASKPSTAETQILAPADKEKEGIDLIHPMSHITECQIFLDKLHFKSDKKMSSSTAISLIKRSSGTYIPHALTIVVK